MEWGREVVKGKGENGMGGGERAGGVEGGEVKVEGK